MIKKNTSIIIEKAENGYIVKEYAQKTETILVFNCMGYASGTGEYGNRSEICLLKFIESHFKDEQNKV